jgi:hypothetical protein
MEELTPDELQEEIKKKTRTLKKTGNQDTKTHMAVKHRQALICWNSG